MFLEEFKRLKYNWPVSKIGTPEQSNLNKITFTISTKLNHFKIHATFGLTQDYEIDEQPNLRFFDLNELIQLKP